MNSSEYPVKVIFFTKNKLIGEQLFPNNITLGEIKYFYQQNLSDGKTLLFNTYYINSNKIEDSNIISRHIQPAPNAKLLDISIAIELIDSKEQINASVNLDDRNEQIYTQIIQPKLNPFGLIVFFPQYNKIQFEEYPLDYLEKKGLKYIDNNKLIYCNSPNELFSSLAENSDDLWIIKNKNYGITKKTIPYEKNNYSMIYVPNYGESGSVFFIGGDNCRTFLYDIKARVFENWGNMLNSHFEPASYVYGDYLYCFNSLNENNTYFQKTFLGCNTRRMWEKVYPRFKEFEPKEFYNNNFAASKSTEGTILFVGGTNASDNTFIFNPLNNTMIKTNGENEKIDFDDKKFYSLNKLIDIAMPSNFERNHELALLNKYNYSLTKIKYKVGHKNSNINLISTIEKFKNLFDENNQKGNISLEGKFFSSNQNNPIYVFRRTIGKPVFNQINKWLQSRKKQKYYNLNNLNNINNINYKNEMQKSMFLNYKNEIQKSIDINNKNEIHNSMDTINNKKEIQLNISQNNNQQISIVHNNDIQLSNRDQEQEQKNVHSSEIINTIYQKNHENENEKQKENDNEKQNENENEKQNEQPYEEQSKQPIELKRRRKKKHKTYIPEDEPNNYPIVFDTYNNEEQYVEQEIPKKQDNSRDEDSSKKQKDDPFNIIKASFDLKIKEDFDDLSVRYCDYDKLKIYEDEPEKKEIEIKVKTKKDLESNKKIEIFEKYKNSDQIIENENEEKATEKNDEKEEEPIYKKDTFENYVISHNIDNIEENSEELSENQQNENKTIQNKDLKEEEGLNEIKEEEKENTENVESKIIDQEMSDIKNNKDKKSNNKENEESNNIIKDYNNNDNNKTKNNPINLKNKNKEDFFVNTLNNQNVSDNEDKEQQNENHMNINNDEENEQKEIEDNQDIKYIQNNEGEEMNNNNQKLEGGENNEQIKIENEEEKKNAHGQEHEQEQGQEGGEYHEEENVYQSIEEGQEEGEQFNNNEEEQQNNENEEGYEHEHEQFYQYSGEENEQENINYEIEEIKNNSNQNKGKKNLIKISETIINKEEIIKKEENNNNKRLKKYQRFVKNVEYNEKDGNVIENQKEEIIKINNQDKDNIGKNEK